MSQSKIEMDRGKGLLDRWWATIAFIDKGVRDAYVEEAQRRDLVVWSFPPWPDHVDEHNDPPICYWGAKIGYFDTEEESQRVSEEIRRQVAE